MVNFYLDAFDNTITNATGPTAPGRAVVAAAGSVTFNYDVAASVIQGAFQYKVQDDDWTSATQDKMNFRTVGAASPFSATIDTDTHNNGLPAITGATYTTALSPITVYAATPSEPNHFSSIGEEYVLFLAEHIFNDAKRHKYFSNEVTIANALSDQDIGAAITTLFSHADQRGTVTDTGVVGTMDTSTTASVSQKMFQNIINGASTRIAEPSGGDESSGVVSTVGTWINMPVVATDTISIVLTISPETTAVMGISAPADRLVILKFTLT